ncbi:MAG: carboxypeptidase-like regulatory domain-containing protein [Pedobacter sp.]|nr:carboxypeptidase-like regulatory domain-containing protein [Chitinophagaceae bacterium]
MKNDLYIHIPQPCHEDWQKMTPETQGRFCSSCSKTVVDFSVMTDNDVLNFLNKNKSNLCGHFATDQLQRPIIETQLQPKRSFKYWLASVASLLVMMQKSVGQNGRTAITTKGDTVILVDSFPTIIMGKIARQPIPNLVNNKISGTVLDEQNQPIVAASVMIKNSTKGVLTNADGKFSLSTTDKKVTVVVSYVGFESKEITMSGNNNQPIILKMSSATLGEVVVVGYGNRRINCTTAGGISVYRKITKIDTITTTIAKVFKNEAFTIYPNPVAKNGTINLSIKEAGMYDLQVLNNQSKLLYSQQHVTESTKQVVQFGVPSGALPGLYYIRLINTINSKQWVDKLIIQ